tara:strand:+ start:3977 stop:4321 length:345 start_codon:yes stop_codon:yes gene_type:complete
MKVKEFNDIKYYIGENALDNWNLFDNSNIINENYIWFHLNSFASPYVIMYATINEIKHEKDSYLNYGATLCLANSKYSYLKDTKIIYSELKKLKRGNVLGNIIVHGKKNLITAN